MAEEKLLIVEDDPGLQSQLKWCFDAYQTLVAGDRSEALALLKKERPRVVITDLGLPPDPGGSSEGFALLGDVLSIDPNIKVIVVTGREEKENAVSAIGMGAYDFYQKPIDVDTLKFVVQRAFRLIELEDANRNLLSAQADPQEGMIGTCPEMLDVFRTIEKVANTSISILVLGETGTGKGEVAKSIHSRSERNDQRLVTINCTSIPEALLESELFGHEKGAFTGAVSRKIGKIEYASGGTLFLDEIGDMPIPLQAKILHVLQEKTITRLGGNDEIPVDVRIICATHQDLKNRIEEGLFREDLYYRISEITIEVPSLRERGDDIILLSQYFLNRFSEKQGKATRKFNQDAINALKGYDWPGNIRELENRIKRAVVMADKSMVSVADLELEGRSEAFEALPLKEIRAEAEKKAVISALIHSKTISNAATGLGVSRPTLYNLIGKYDLDQYVAGKKEKDDES